MPPSVFPAGRGMLRCASHGRLWWRGGVARRSSGLVALPSRPAMAARERGLAQPSLLLVGETSLSCQRLQPPFAFFPGVVAASGSSWWSRLPSFAWEHLGSSSPAACGRWFRRPIRTQGCRAPLPLLRPQCLLRCRLWCGDCGRQPRRNLEMMLRDWIMFLFLVQGPFRFLLGQCVILFLWGLSAIV
jgi:hypothetical protein